MSKIQLSNGAKYTILIVLCVALLVGAVFGILALVNSKKETKTVNPSYSVGSLSEDGKYQANKASIYTKDSFACNGLKVDVAFNGNIKYQLFFYDFDGNYISSTSLSAENFSTETPFTAKSCRVVIVPNNDDEVKWNEVSKYAKQLSISVSDTQFDSVENKIESLEKFEAEYDGIGIFDTQKKEFVESASPWSFTKDINTENYSQMILKIPTSTITGSVLYSDRKMSSLFIYHEDDPTPITYEIIKIDNGMCYVVYNISDYNRIRIAIETGSVDSFEIYFTI